MKNWFLPIALFFLCSCSEEIAPNVKDHEKAILEVPITNDISSYPSFSSELKLFKPEKGLYGYLFSNNSEGNIRNGFAGPFTQETFFEQFISFDIQGDDDWILVDQNAYPGRLVQNSRKGHFQIEQTLFFAERQIAIVRIKISNDSEAPHDLSTIWKIKVNEGMKLEPNRKYGLRFLKGRSEYWPFTSGTEAFIFSDDSLILTRFTKARQLFPQESIFMYSLLYLREAQDSIRHTVRPKPWMFFPEEAYQENCLEFGKNLLEN